LKLLSALILCTALATTAISQTTARLTIENATCSGTVVAQNTILSAAHCFKDDEAKELAEMFGLKYVEPPPPATMLVDGYKVYILALVYDDADHVMVKTDISYKHYAKLGRQPAVGAKIHYWGNAAGLNNVYREGYVTGYPHGELTMDVNGFFGDSGSGIFNEAGELVGVISYITPHAYEGIVFRLMGGYPIEFTPLQYDMMGVTPPRE
jgi:V8-like Glu-specific endopeptidase